MKRTVGILIALVAVLFTAACSMPPDTEPIPVFPGATEVGDEEGTMAHTMKQAVEEAQTEQGFEVESQIYTLPEGTDFAQVEDFYTGELSGRDWTFEEEAGGNMVAVEGVNTAAWSHGPDQVFLVMTVDNPLSGEQILLTLEATR